MEIEKPLKKSKRYSVVWYHYTLSDCKTKATCVHCSEQFAFRSTGISNLSRHVKRKHPEISLEDKSFLTEPRKQVNSEEVEYEEDTYCLKVYEVNVNSLDELGQEVSDKSNIQSDPDWLPEADENLKLKNSENSPKNKTSKVKRSAIWNHFDKSDCGTFAQCVHCQNSIKLGSLSNLARHLRHKHPTLPLGKPTQDTAGKNDTTKGNDDNSFLEYDIEISSEMKVEDFSSQFNFEQQVDEFGFPVGAEVQEPNANQESQTECLLDEDFDMCDYLKPKRALVVSEQVDSQLVKMIVKGCHPLKIVEQSEFKDLLTLLNPKYKLPDTGKMCKELIPTMYTECVKRISNSLRDAEGISLSVDMWVSKRIRYMSVSAHFVNTQCELESFFLSCHVLSRAESPTEISERLLETVGEWEISDKIVAVTTDDTIPLLTIATKLCPWTQVPHFIKTLNLILNECLQSVKGLVIRVRNHVEVLTSSDELLTKLYSSAKLPQARLFIPKTDCYWNSDFLTLEMLTRYVNLKRAICQPDLPKTNLTEAEWKSLKCIVDVLSIFKTTKQEVMVEGKATLAKVAFYLKALKKEMIKQQNDKNNPSGAIHVAAVGEKSLSTHFKDIEETDLIQKSLLLDPRLKKHVFGDESESVAACFKLKQEVCAITLADKIYEESNSDSIWYAFDKEVKKLNEIKDPIGKGVLEFENYLQEQLLQRNENPLIWWKQRQSIYPRLYKLAKKYLCVTTRPPTREPISYRCAFMLNKLKDNAPNNLVSELMFLNHNV